MVTFSYIIITAITIIFLKKMLHLKFNQQKPLSSYKFDKKKVYAFEYRVCDPENPAIMLIKVCIIVTITRMQKQHICLLTLCMFSCSSFLCRFNNRRKAAFTSKVFFFLLQITTKVTVVISITITNKAGY